MAVYIAIIIGTAIPSYFKALDRNPVEEISISNTNNKDTIPRDPCQGSTDPQSGSMEESQSRGSIATGSSSKIDRKIFELIVLASKTRYRTGNPAQKPA